MGIVGPDEQIVLAGVLQYPGEVIIDEAGHIDAVILEQITVSPPRADKGPGWSAITHSAVAGQTVHRVRDPHGAELDKPELERGKALRQLRGDERGKGLGC